MTQGLQIAVYPRKIPNKLSNMDGGCPHWIWLFGNVSGNKIYHLS